MKKSYAMLLKIVAILVILVVLYYVYKFLYNLMIKNSLNKDAASKNYKWITEGTCASNNMTALQQNECSNYLLKSNYNITVANHGPPGCWLVLGDALDQRMQEQPQFAGKGFACWSQNETDGMSCSPDIPCVCKK